MLITDRCMNYTANNNTLERIKDGLEVTFKQMSGTILCETSKKHTEYLLSKYDELEQKGFRIDNHVRNREDKSYIMYKLNSLCINEKCYYEFLIEYDACSPSLGIYYGCKAITKEPYTENEHTRFIEKLYKKHWNDLSLIITNRLKAMFSNYPEVIVIHMTDNEDSGTYWPFWIRLNRNCDLLKVAANSLFVIRCIYKKYLNGEYDEYELCNLKNDDETHVFIPNYTEEAYNILIENIHKNWYTKSCSTKSTPKELLDCFLIFLKKEKIVVEVPEFERGYAIQRNRTELLGETNLQNKGISNIDKHEDFVLLIGAFFEFLNRYYDKTICKIPWTSIVRIFMSETYEAFIPEDLKVPMSRSKYKIKEENFPFSFVNHLYEYLKKQNC